MKRALLLVLVAVVAFPTLLLARALALPSRQLQVTPAPRIALDEDALAKRLGAALRAPVLRWLGAA